MNEQWTTQSAAIEAGHAVLLADDADTTARQLLDQLQELRDTTESTDILDAIGRLIGAAEDVCSGLCAVQIDLENEADRLEAEAAALREDEAADQPPEDEAADRLEDEAP